MADRAAPWDAVSDDYDEWIISPFASGVEFPLRGDVRRLLARWKRRGGLERRIVLDIGCGRGDGLALVAGRVGVALGLDFSPRMLAVADRFLRARGVVPTRASLRRAAAAMRAHDAGSAPRTMLVQADMRALRPLRRSADLVLAITSIIPARPGQAARLFGEVVSTLKPGGTLMAVMPSLDAFQYLVALVDRLGARLPDLGHVDGHGMFHESGEQQQFYGPAHIRALCNGAGVRVLALRKVRYPWQLVRRFGWGYFPGRPRLWDWYLVGRVGT